MSTRYPVFILKEKKNRKAPKIMVKGCNEEAPDGDWVKIVFNIDKKIDKKHVKLKPILESEGNKLHQEENLHEVALYVEKGAEWKDIACYIPEVEFTGDNENQYPRWTPEFPDNDKTAEDGDKEFTMLLVENPWKEFYEDTKERKQYIATGDRGYIARYMHEKQSSKLVFNTLPGPFFGNITTAKVVLLLNNPGLHLKKGNQKEESAGAEDTKCNFWRSMALKCLNPDDFEKCSGYYFIDPTRNLESQLGEDILSEGEVGDEIDLSYLSNEYYRRAQRLLFKAYGIEIEEYTKTALSNAIVKFEELQKELANRSDLDDLEKELREVELRKVIEDAKTLLKGKNIQDSKLKAMKTRLEHTGLRAKSGIECKPEGDKKDSETAKIIFHDDPLERKRKVRLLTLVGTLYWQKAIEPLIKPPVTHVDLLKHFAFINHFPYHSSDSGKDNFDNSELLKLPTRKYTAHLLKKAIDNHATIILARAEDSNKKWYEECLDSEPFTYHYRCANPRSWSFEKMVTREEYDEIENLKMPKNFKCLKEKLKEAQSL